MILSKKIAVYALGSLVLISCGDNKEQENMDRPDTTAAPVDTTPDTVSDTTKFKFDFAIANIPSPATSLQELSRYHVEYDNTILNDGKKASSYTTEFQKSINLGIYNIDMAYAMLNGKGQDVLQYMKHVLVMSDALGLKNAVSSMVGKRAEANLNNKDSLFRILDEIYAKSDSYLRNNERVYTAALVFTGGWIESLYLDCKMSEMAGDASTKEMTRKQLWDQRFHLGNLLNLLNDFKDKKEGADLHADLKVIHEEIVKVKQPTDFNDEKFALISGKIYALRTKVTK